MKVRLDDRHTLISDQYCCWIEQTRHSEEKGTNYQVRVTGYCATFERVFESYLNKRLLGSDPETVRELLQVIKDLKEEVMQMCDKIDVKVLEAIE